MGDPAGVGPESVIYSLNSRQIGRTAKTGYCIIGSKNILRKIPGADRVLSKVELIDLDNVSEKEWRWGRLGRYSGQAAREYLDTALALLKKDSRTVLVTAPVSKEAIQSTGVSFPGHTEYLAAKTRTKDFIMLFKGARLFISLITRHVPLRSVSGLLNNTALTRNTISLTYQACKTLTSVKKPRVGICSFNPHAGVDTFLGKEEKHLIRAKKALSFEKNIHGPFPADSLIAKAYQGLYDAIVCAYHDQAMIPFKMLDFDTGVNITYGLPFIRVSPVYGTAKDIAGKGTVNTASMTSALLFAEQCASHNKQAR